MVLLINLHFPMAMLVRECIATYWYVMSQKYIKRTSTSGGNDPAIAYETDRFGAPWLYPPHINPTWVYRLTSADLGYLRWALKMTVWKKSFQI